MIWYFIMQMTTQVNHICDSQFFELREEEEDSLH